MWVVQKDSDLNTREALSPSYAPGFLFQADLEGQKNFHRITYKDTHDRSLQTLYRSSCKYIESQLKFRQILTSKKGSKKKMFIPAFVKQNTEFFQPHLFKILSRPHHTFDHLVNLKVLALAGQATHSLILNANIKHSQQQHFSSARYVLSLVEIQL